MLDIMIKAHLLMEGARDRALGVIRRDAGQATAEYVGVILFLVVVIAALSQSEVGKDVADAIGNAIRAAIEKVGGE